MNTPIPPEEVAEAAKRLTKGMRAVLLRGLHGSYTISTLYALKRRGLMTVRFASQDEPGWRRTALGEAVAAHLATPQAAAAEGEGQP